MPERRVSRAELPAGLPVVEVLVASGLATSKAEARRGIQGKGFYLNGRPIEDVELRIGERFAAGATRETFSDPAEGEEELRAARSRYQCRRLPGRGRGSRGPERRRLVIQYHPIGPRPVEPLAPLVVHLGIRPEREHLQAIGVAHLSGGAGHLATEIQPRAPVANSLSGSGSGHRRRRPRQRSRGRPWETASPRGSRPAAQVLPRMPLVVRPVPPAVGHPPVGADREHDEATAAERGGANGGHSFRGST